MLNKSVIHILTAIFCLFSCSHNSDSIPETATSGVLTVASDEAYLPILKQEIDIFSYLYKYAIVNDLILPQEICHELFLKDSVEMIFSSRNLNQNEISYLKSKNVFPKVYEFARDGIVLVLNQANNDSIISLPDISMNICSIVNNNVFVVDNSRGGMIQSLIEKLKIAPDSVKNIYSADSVGGVLDYVKKHPNAIGIISSTCIADRDNKKVKEIVENLKIARICLKKGEESYLPFQSEIADSLYPLSRTIYVISREAKMGLANGFASFLLGEKGQRVILKSGLLPSRIPSREVVVTKKNIY